MTDSIEFMSLKTDILEKQNQIIRELNKKSTLSCVEEFCFVGADFPRLNFLGTGCAMPSKYRNVSGILFELCESISIILDCGESSLFQISLLKDSATLANLKCIFVSHMHADHHLGLISILYFRSKLTDVPCFVIGPAILEDWIRECQSIMNLDFDFRFFCAELFLPLDGTAAPKEELVSLLKELNLSAFEVVSVEHTLTEPSYACVLTSEIYRFKVVYSGDCRPSLELVKRSMNATVCIHEATFEDELHNEAIAKKHCTVNEAIKVGCLMNAERIILTHFSQRYPKFPAFAANCASNVCIAFDLMTISFKKLLLLPTWNPLLQLMEQVDETEIK